VPLSLSDIREVIDSGDTERFVGEMEGQHLDAKRQPYAFSASNGFKREFAKDVAAFANAAGGCILIGAETTVSPLRAGEQITSLKPFPLTLFDVDQHSKIIEEWLYPLPAGLIIKRCADPATPTSGIGFVFVPMQDPTTKPFLLTRTIGEKKSTELLFGYAERRLDRTGVKTVIELHHALRTGMNLEATLLERITALEALLERQLNATSGLPPSPPVSPAVTAARVARVLSQPPLND
jgi:hypothetical protein